MLWKEIEIGLNLHRSPMRRIRGTLPESRSTVTPPSPHQRPMTNPKQLHTPASTTRTRLQFNQCLPMRSLWFFLYAYQTSKEREFAWPKLSTDIDVYDVTADCKEIYKKISSKKNINKNFQDLLKRTKNKRAALEIPLHFIL